MLIVFFFTECLHPSELNRKGRVEFHNFVEFRNDIICGFAASFVGETIEKLAICFVNFHGENKKTLNKEKNGKLLKINLMKKLCSAFFLDYVIKLLLWAVNKCRIMVPGRCQNKTPPRLGTKKNKNNTKREKV